MSPSITELSCSRYPAVYGSSLCFEWLDGWSGVLNALPKTVVWHGQIQRTERVEPCGELLVT